MFNRKRKVAMVLSVGDREAGKTYKLAAAKADEMILKGYALGNLSRTYTEAEKNGLLHNSQVVVL